MFRCAHICSLFLAASAILILLAGTALADCDSYAGRLQGLDGQISQEAANSNELMARMNSTLDEFGRVNDQDVEPGSREEMEALGAMKQLMGQVVDLCEQRVQVHSRLISLYGDGYSMLQKGVNEGCFGSDALAGVSQYKADEEKNLQITQDHCSKFRANYAQVNNAIAQRESTAGQAEEPPTVRIVNNMGIPACIHPGGQSAGMCIDPGQERVYRLDKLTGLDTDSGQRTPTKTIVVVGGGVWQGSPYTEYRDMTVCTKKRFGHESGEEVWYITGGLEQNCGIRGYHQ